MPSGQSIIASALRLFAIALLLFALLLIVALTTLSQSLPYAAERILAHNNIDFSVDHLGVKLTKGKLKLRGLELRAEGSEHTLRLDTFELAVSIKSLARGRVDIKRLAIDGVNIPVEQSETAISVAGIGKQHLEAFAKNRQSATRDSEKKTSADKATPLQWSQIVLENIRVDYRRPNDISMQPLAAIVKTLAIDSFSTFETERATPVAINALIDGIGIIADGELALAKIPHGRFNAQLNNIQLEQLAQRLADFSVAIPTNLAAAKGKLSGKANLDWSMPAGSMTLALQSAQFNAESLVLPLDNDEQSPKISGDIISTFGAVKISSNAGSDARTNLVVNDFRLRDTQLVYVDQRHQPSTKLAFNKLNLHVDKFSSTQPELLSQLTLNSAVGKFGSMQLAGKLSLLQPQQQTMLQVSGEQIALPEFSGYSTEFLQRPIDKGALDFSTDVKLERGMIDSLSKLQLHQLEFGRSKAAQGGERKPLPIETELGMPLNTALNLLRDKNDTIALKIPVSGAVDDPQVNLNHIIRDAVFKTIKTAALTQLGPLLAISALDKLKNLADATRLKSLKFTSASVELNSVALNSEQKQTLDNIASLLEQRKRLVINICSYASSTELTSVAAASPNTAPDALAKLMEEQLLELAASRANAAKTYLTSKGIDGKRLALCRPKIEDDADAQPRVEFSL